MTPEQQAANLNFFQGVLDNEDSTDLQKHLARLGLENEIRYTSEYGWEALFNKASGKWNVPEVETA